MLFVRCCVGVGRHAGRAIGLSTVPRPSAHARGIGRGWRQGRAAAWLSRDESIYSVKRTTRAEVVCALCNSVYLAVRKRVDAARVMDTKVACATIARLARASPRRRLRLEIARNTKPAKALRPSRVAQAITSCSMHALRCACGTGAVIDPSACEIRRALNERVQLRNVHAAEARRRVPAGLRLVAVGAAAVVAGRDVAAAPRCSGSTCRSSTRETRVHCCSRTASAPRSP